jgi:hypothetical protein
MREVRRTSGIGRRGTQINLCSGNLREWGVIKNSRRFKHNIKMDDKWVECNRVEWRYMARIKGPIVGRCEQGNFLNI